MSYTGTVSVHIMNDADTLPAHKGGWEDDEFKKYYSGGYVARDSSDDRIRTGADRCE